MRVFFRNACLSVCLFPLLASIPSLADPLTLAPASAFVQLEVNGVYGGGYLGLDTMYPGLQNTHQQGFSNSNVNINASGSNTAGDVPTVSSFITFSGRPANQLNMVSSQMAYEFAISGPDGQTVSVDIASSGDAGVTTVTSGFFAASELEVHQVGDTTDLVLATACAGNFTNVTGACGNISPVSSASFDIDPILTLQTNTIYVVDLYSEVSFFASSSDSPGNYFGFSEVDPTITLDTSDPAYSLVLSPGLEPAPTPEPETLALTASGFLATLACVRQRVARS